MRSFGRVAVFACVVGLFAAEAQAAKVAVVKSDNFASYNEVVTAYSVQTPDSLAEYNLAKSVAGGRKVFQQLLADPPDLVLAIGPLAASLAKETLSKTPVLFVLVPEALAQQIKSDSNTGIALSVPALVQLKLFKQVLGDLKRVGVLHYAAESSPLLEEAKTAASRLGITLVLTHVDNEGAIPAALNALKGRVDALWLVPDEVVATANAHAVFVDFARNAKIPFMTLTPKMVRAGGLFSLSPDYSAIGEQAALLANKILREKVPASAIPVTPPEGLQMAFNLGTAKKLGTENELSVRLVNVAATTGFPLLVFK